MLARDLPAYEREFAQTGVDSAGKRHDLRPLSVDIPGEDAQLTVMRCKPVSGDTSFYYRENYRKERVVLHFTAGYLKGDIATLTRQNRHVSVPFVIARDGTIYNLWSSGYWSYHLGEGAAGGNTTMSQLSVAIEISNIGPLRLQGNRLVGHNGKPYCEITEREYYQDRRYRGYDYYATYTEAQYESVIKLLRYLTGKYHIPRQFLPEDSRYEMRPDIAEFYGITSHVNFRADKFDIGPAFNWERVIGGVTA